MNPAEILTIATSVYTLASLVTRWTKTKKDDEVVSKVWKFFNSIFNGQR